DAPVIEREDLWPTPQANSLLVVRDHYSEITCVGVICVSEGISVSDGNHVIKISPSTSNFHPSLFTITPVCSNGWSLLGQIDKFVALSNYRFHKIECCISRDCAFHVSIRGDRGETIMLYAYNVFTRAVIRKNITFFLDIQAET